MISQIDKQLIRAYLAPRLAKLAGSKPANGPRIAVIGNCQSYGLAYAMKLLDPTAQIDHFSTITRSRANIDQFVGALSAYDKVFYQDFFAGVVRGGDSRDLERRLTNGVRVFTPNFAAFQPDLVYLSDHSRGGKIFYGALGAYHSALAVFAFRIGLPLEAANALFNRNVYDLVGYLDIWAPAATELVDSAKSYGLDLSAEFLKWSRRGVFMYSINHPKPYVLADIARKLFAQADLEVRNDAIEDFFIDDLARSEIFPVYPEIGAVYGVPGAYLFKRGNYHISHGVGEFLTLPQFLSESYAFYRKAKPEQIGHPRIDGWLADAELSKRLAALAQDNLAKRLAPVL